MSAYVGAPVRLVRARRDGDAQDVHPLTIVSSASVRDLGARGDRSDLDGRRFRINLEVDGVEPYRRSWDGRDVRDRRGHDRVGGQIPRCVVTTLAPIPRREGLRTLNPDRRYRPRIGPKGGLPFGMYARAVTTGRVRVGDPVEADQLGPDGVVRRQSVRSQGDREPGHERCRREHAEDDAELHDVQDGVHAPSLPVDRRSAYLSDCAAGQTETLDDGTTKRKG